VTQSHVERRRWKRSRKRAGATLVNFMEARGDRQRLAAYF